jgi:hypothetical protein
MKIINKLSLPYLTEFVNQELACYNTEQIERITVGYTTKSLYGYCHYPKSPYRKKEKYYINVRIPKETQFPYTHLHWGRVQNENYKQGWYSGTKEFVFPSVEIASVHIVFHEIFHFLAHSKQMQKDQYGNTIKNVEANANWYADLMLAKYLGWKNEKK